jgi:hypothetical protein
MSNTAADLPVKINESNSLNAARAELLGAAQ